MVGEGGSSLLSVAVRKYSNQNLTLERTGSKFLGHSRSREVRAGTPVGA